MNGYAFSVYAEKRLLFETKRIHAAMVIWAENEDEARGKALKIAEKTYSGEDGWQDLQLSPAIKFISGLEKAQ